ncbi:MAG: UDP-N-acetylmuramoyl-tripeptide--D-alanyl-D-alanine ligase [Proteobacteria bacterium]|nr:UDP-N-acetylmuramoyl-tripeptide--D-alanyl-D-alanine ligase [Pseudomonadota bacterium]MBU1717336.1 UDP-N-acetylmuramoyl-tripeptide--D-alanyl-D-alanine ligase [Pseudomonadota bacterium]
MASSGSYSAGFGYGFATAQNPVWTLDQVLLATGGRIVCGRYQAGFRSISTDSRAIEAGDLFLALEGERYDALAFVEDVVNKGAAGVIVARIPEVLPSVPVILVDNTLKALGDLAAYRRSLMRNLKVMAITGSSGKTTVKEMVSTILETKMNVLKTRGNFNNLVGLPLSLLPVDYRHDVAVLEMGMNLPGEIARLTEIADPDIACINNIQGAHLQGLDDIEGVARAKGELFAGIKSWGKLVVNLDDQRVRRLVRKSPQEIISFGRNQKAFIRATHVKSLGAEGMVFTLHIGGNRARLKVKCFGQHNVLNSLAAAAMATCMRMNIDEIAHGLSAFTPYDKRMQVQKMAGGMMVVNDSYNANPASMLAALETLQDLRRGRKSVVILGDMLELGRESVAAHRFVGETVARLKCDYLFALGSFANNVTEAARKSGMVPRQARSFDGKSEIIDELNGLIKAGKITKGDWILVKGSRGMKMEDIIADLELLEQGSKS